MAKEQGLVLAAPGGLLKQVAKSVIDTALSEELPEHLGSANTIRRVGSLAILEMAPEGKRP